MNHGEKTQSERLQDFLNDYSVNVQMNGIYSYDAMTLKSDSSRMVITMHSFRAGGNHISYSDYVHHPGVEHFEHEPDMLQEGYHFHLVEKSDGLAVFVSENRRFFGSAYLGQQPTFSPNQGLVCLERTF